MKFSKVYFQKAFADYFEAAKARRLAGEETGLPPETKWHGIEAIAQLASQNDRYRLSDLGQMPPGHPQFKVAERVAEECLRFGPILKPLSDFLFLTAQYPLLERLTPFRHSDEIDRKTSKLGTPLWVCEKYPWPLAKDQSPLSPLLQLNLEELHEGLISIADFPPVLVQVWGDGWEPVVRVIPLKDIKGQLPQNPGRDWTNEHLYYAKSKMEIRSNQDQSDNSGSQIISEKIGIDRRSKLLLPQNSPSYSSVLWLITGELERILQDTKLPISAEKQDVDELSEYLEHLGWEIGDEETCSEWWDLADKNEKRSGSFGGSLNLVQSNLTEFFLSPSRLALRSPKCWMPLYQPYNRGGWDEGLSILFDGSLALLWRQTSGGEFEFKALADR